MEAYLQTEKQEIAEKLKTMIKQDEQQLKVEIPAQEEEKEIVLGFSSP